MSDLSRRSVIKTAAWGAPAVVVAATAPAYATSDPKGPKCTVKGTRHDCAPKHKGGKVTEYEYRVTVGCGKAGITSVYIADKKATPVRDKRGNTLYWTVTIKSKLKAASVLIKTTQGDTVVAVSFR